MVDLESRKIVDMIESREYAEVKEWLQTYPNLHLVSRDGSVTYRNAITDAHPSAIQISDRFHLLKNLTSYGREYLKKELSQKIPIPATDTIADKYLSPASQADKNRTLTLKEKYEEAQQLAMLGYAKTRICKSLNMDIRVFDKLMSATPETLDMRFESNKESIHQEKTQQKMKLVNEVRELWRIGFSKREISRRTGLAFRTISRYLDESFTPIHAAHGKKKSGALSPYMDEINRLVTQGIKSTVIFQCIQEKGYSGSPSNLRHYVADWKKHQKHLYQQGNSAESPKQILERKHVFQLLYHPLEKVKSISQAQFDSLLDNYPCFEKIYALIWSFKTILVTKDDSLLEMWMMQARGLGIREINSFVEGLGRDLEAVKNAVIRPESNGLAEGSVNKLKVIKRIMYGRCSFNLLKNKCLHLQYLN